MTGTDGPKADKSIRLGVVPGVVTGRAPSHQRASINTSKAVGANSGDVPQTLEMVGAGASLHRPASPRNSAPSRARTEDPLIKSQLLYQLS
jgi:hypothetical protein